MGFFIEVVLGGLMAGVLYSLVALGFVLIFKASGVFNFAQGAMVLFAALAMARLAEWLPELLGFESLLLANLLAFILAAGIMVLVAQFIERLVLRPLVNQEGVTLLMATLGVTYFLDGFGQTIWGSDVYKIDLGLSKDPLLVLDNIFEGGLLLNRDDIAAALIAVLLVAVLALFFQKTATGRALRAVADDHQAAQSIGIQQNLGDRLGGGRLYRIGRGHGVGSEAGRAVLARHPGTEGAAGGDCRWLYLGARGHRRRSSDRPGRKAR
jgi:branched-chain amino acid transport system permease protein